MDGLTDFTRDKDQIALLNTNINKLQEYKKFKLLNQKINDLEQKIDILTEKLESHLSEKVING